MDFLEQTKERSSSTWTSFSYIPPRRKDPKERSYFNRECQASDISGYDRLLHVDQGLDIKLPRGDRKHWNARGLHVNREEMERVVPVLSSSVYGHRPPLPDYGTNRGHARVSCIKPEFYRKSGILWNVAEGYGSVVPF